VPLKERPFTGEQSQARLAINNRPSNGARPIGKDANEKRGNGARKTGKDIWLLINTGGRKTPKNAGLNSKNGRT
jgi:hypothetical protein